MGCSSRLAWQLAILMLLGAEAVAGEPLVWESNLERGLQTAGQTNRLVLVHFWGPSCGWCKWMDAQVFTQAEVVQQIQANYVPVKINASQYPEIAKKYGITNLPSDVVLTPQGQMIYMAIGKSDPGPYVARLNQWSAGARSSLANLPASLPGNAPGTNVNPPSLNQPLMNPPLAATTPGMPVSNFSAPQPGLPGPPAGPSLGSNGSVNGVPATGVSLPPEAPLPPSMPNAAYSNTPPIANNPPTINNVPPMDAQVNTPSMNMPPANTPPANAALPPDRNPPMAFDGYCPVSLVEKQQWVRGDKRYGAYHQGRTYLFAGPEEQRKFLASFNRYAPVASGLDVVLAVDEHKAIPGQRAHGVFFAEHVFLFSSEATLEKFSKNPSFYAGQPLGALRQASSPGQPPR